MDKLRTDEKVKIVEYEPKYAKSIAEMWNNSIDGWNGELGDTLSTEEQIIQEYEQSNNIKVFLATIGDKVVGYCSFAEYKEDKGALYIPLLNVRDDYHGKRIGKKLVLRAVNEAINMKWPRLDLYTWPGNTKAVPLYKKTGFFWENKEGSTHLMNFIPTVLNAEIFKDFFQVADWYNDSKREIVVEPDGKKDNDTHYFEYIWKRADNNDPITNNLRVVFEQLSRGLCCIETDDYYIKSYLKEQKLVFGKDYNINYEIKNKSGKELNIKIKGINDENLSYNFNKEITIKDSANIEAGFSVGEINKKPNLWKTQPAVISEVEINGKKALFKNGVITAFPVSITSERTDEYLCQINKENNFVLNLENNFNEDIELKLILPEKDFIKIKQKEFNIDLKAKEKSTLLVPYIINRNDYYTGKIQCQVKIKNDKVNKDNNEIKFSKKISIAFPGLLGAFGGIDENNTSRLYNGLYSIIMETNDDNWTIVFNQSNFNIFLKNPEIGRPFKAEFTKIEAEGWEIYDIGNGGIGAKTKMVSKQFNGIILYPCYEIYPNGAMHFYYEIKNESESETPNNIETLLGFGGLADNNRRPVIPTKNGIVQCDNQINILPNLWNSKEVSENWMFFKGNNDDNIGIHWEKGKLSIEEWFMTINENLGKIPAGQSVKSSGLWYYSNTFTDYRIFREYITGKTIISSEKIHKDIELNVNEANPFINDELGNNIDISLKSNKTNMPFSGKLLITSNKACIKDMVAEVEKKDEITELSYYLKSDKISENDLIKAKFSFPTYDVIKENVIYKKSTTSSINTEKTKEKGLNVYKADNGIISLKSSPEYYGNLYSMRYKGIEWLDNSFPKPIQKSWFNPYPGGIFSKINRDMSFNTLHKEKKKAEFITKKDNYDNLWTGIKVNYCVEEKKEFKNLEWNQYYLMLPGSPVVVNYTEIINNTGHYHNSSWLTTTFLNPYEDMNKAVYSFEGENGKWYENMRVSEISSNELTFKGLCRIGHREQKTKCSIILNNDEIDSSRIETNMNKILSTFTSWKTKIKSGDKFISPVFFFVFHKEDYKLEAMKNLIKIRFVD